MEKYKSKKFIVLGPIFLVAIWFITTNLNLINPLFLPTPQKVAVALFSSLIHVDIWRDLVFTLYRAFIALAMGASIGVPLGLLMGYFDRFYYSFEFIIEFFRSTPATALFPLFLLFFGIGDLAKIMLVFWAVLFIIIVHSIYGVRLGKRSRYRVAKVMGFSGFPLFRKFIFPEALPQILAGLRIALSTSLIIVVVTEMFIGTQIGLGKRIIDFQLVYRIPEMYAAILLVGIAGYILNKLFISQEKRVVHWSGK
ncbi:MAG: ABC transporter permease [Bacteroidia bacterium]|nr:ABC transporter permease [Bacteroidia bacterium]